MSREALGDGLGDDYLCKYHAKQKKKENRERDTGNFIATLTGDLAPTRYLTRHAKERMKERGVTLSDAIKGTKKSGAIIADNGAVVTTIHESWKNNMKLLNKKANKQEYQNKGRFVPAVDNLPEGHVVVKIPLQPNVIGHVLGKGHSNIRKLTENHAGTKYCFDGVSTITIRGPDTLVNSLRRKIEIVIDKARKSNGPPVPDGKLPEGHAHRRIVVSDCAIGHVLGKEKQNLRRLRGKHRPAASINFDSKTGVMHVWGEASEVDEICDAVATITEKVKAKNARDNAKKAKVGKKSHDAKMKQYERDMEAFSKGKPDIGKVKDGKGKQSAAATAAKKESKKKQKQSEKEKISFTKKEREQQRAKQRKAKQATRG